MIGNYKLFITLTDSKSFLNKKYELEIERNKHKLIYDAQKEEIETLRKLAKGSNTTLWTTIGFFIGAGTSIAIFYAATEIAK